MERNSIVSCTIDYLMNVVYPALKFFHNIPLVMNSNERIADKLANGTPYEDYI